VNLNLLILPATVLVFMPDAILSDTMFRHETLNLAPLT